MFGHVAIISTSIGSRQVGARGPNDALLATTTGPPRGNDQSRAMPVLLTHDEEFETWLRARPTRRSQDGFPGRPKKGAAQFVAAQPGSRQGGTRRRGEVSKDVIRRFTVPQISGPFHQLESRVLGGQISRPAATAEVATRFPLVCGAANDHPTPSQASTNRYAGSKDGRRDCGRSRSTAPAPTAPIGPQSLRSHNLARSSANSFLSGGSAGYPLPRGGARFCFEASPICLHRRYANNVLFNFEETFR